MNKIPPRWWKQYGYIIPPIWWKPPSPPPKKKVKPKFSAPKDGDQGKRARYH